ncbi:unnamed protein product, partial [marine sediment metagenome]
MFSFPSMSAFNSKAFSIPFLTYSHTWVADADI